MDKERWTAIQNYFKEDDTISDLFGDRIGFVRIPKNMIAEGQSYLIFNEMSSPRDNYANSSFKKGIDMFDVIFDIVVPYQKIGEGRKMRGYIRSLIGKFSGELDNKWSGEIVFKENIEISHNPETDSIVLGSIYLFKEHYDYTDTGPGE